MRHIDLFSGIGGFALAASRVWPDHQIVTFCEKDKYCQKVLKKHWPTVPICEDIYEFDTKKYKNIDCITAGYPCQAFSRASRGRIVADDMSRITTKTICQCLPKFVVLENVQEGTLRQCAKELETFGYGTATRCHCASVFGANHKRNRWWLIAHTHYKSKFLSEIHAKVAELPKMENATWQSKNYARALRSIDGIPNRTHRLRALGNAIVPACVQPIFESIKLF